MIDLIGIIAVNNGGYIGLDGKMPWKCSADMRHFAATTADGILIVGGTTLRNDFKGDTNILPGRMIIPVGRDYHTLWGAVRSACILSYDTGRKVFVAGGLSIYQQLLPLITEWHISHINDDTVGDRIANFIWPMSHEDGTNKINERRVKIHTYKFDVNKPKT
jgi:dihydrofolate reductase